MNSIYPEIVGYKHRGEKVPPPKFPDTCPTCGAPTKSKAPTSIVYKCRGGYCEKPQIQNHTDYFWGRCGKDYWVDNPGLE